LVAPLYPQYCAATTASVVDKVNEELGKMRWQPSLRFLPPYYDEPAYVEALASDIERQLGGLSFEPELLMLSFHGMPQRTFDLGDPYHCHCMKTARLLSEKLGNERMRIVTTFQSRFGRAKWLEPATDTTLIAEAQAGTRKVAIVAPGFSADCVETLEELAIAGREQFCEAGGKEFAAFSCLNDTQAGMDMLEMLLRRELSGWI
jgi:ferrochelatase